jgi:hypothetical protein
MRNAKTEPKGSVFVFHPAILGCVFGIGALPLMCVFLRRITSAAWGSLVVEVKSATDIFFDSHATEQNRGSWR